MPISRQKKAEVIATVGSLLAQSKMTVLVQYAGLSVKEFQQLRRQAANQNVVITVAKNRLVKRALAETDHLKKVDTELLKGQLGLVFGLDDEVAPAQVVAQFAKEHPAIEFIGAYTAEGHTLTAEQVTRLSELPSIDVLRGQVVGTIAAPITGLLRVMNGNISGFINVLQARAHVLEES